MQCIIYMKRTKSLNLYVVFVVLVTFISNFLSKQMLAVLAAVTEVIKENGGKESETEYFAALVR